MCGFIGEFGSSQSPKNEFYSLLKLSINRGPDMVGYYSNLDIKEDQNPYIQFGFNRLSILDLSKNANQPMTTNSGRYVVMCNGEITNYLKLITEMGLRPKDLRTNSDTEVLCHAIDYYGITETINRINGMYAIVIYDLIKQMVYLIRDPAGIKPLYFASTKYGWIFASQYNQIFKHLWFKSDIQVNINSLADYLRLGYIPAPSALFENSWMLQPGAFLTINCELFAHLRQYHALGEKCEYIETDSATAEKLCHILDDTFNDYVHTDVPLGSFLSGGVDSPVVNAVLKKLGHKMNAFTISTKYLGIDEAENAKMISNYLGIKHSIKTLKWEEITTIIDNHFSAYSEPFSDYSSIPTYLLCQEASKDYTVLLSGDGGDELFWGYTRFASVMDYERWFEYPRYFRMIWASILRRLGKKVSSCIEFNNIEDWVFERQSPIHTSQLKKLMPQANHSFNTERLYNIPSSVETSKDLLFWLRKNEFYGHLQRVLLKVDRASMAHGIEVRVPFLDRRIIDFCSLISPELGISHNSTKYLLKKIFKMHMPEDYRLHYKQGFSFDLIRLLKNELKEDFSDTMMSKNLFGDEFIDSNEIYRMVDDFHKGKGTTNEWGLWTLYSLQKWAKLIYNFKF